MNEEKKIPTIREDNVYNIHRKEIGEISHREKVDVGVAASMLTNQKGWGEEVKEDRKEFDTYAAYLFRTNGEENKVAKYFDGE